MNFLFISPNYPVRYYEWVLALKRRGVNVLGIGDTPYRDLSPRLLEGLTEYYFVPDMNDLSSKIVAVDYFQRKYGKIDYLESMNEWWLRHDAILREWFQIDGLLPRDMDAITAKSHMKAVFEKGGAKTIRYLVVHGPEDKEKAKEFLGQVGFPLFVKPDVGVGAASSYALHNEAEFDEFFAHALPEPYIMEEYIDGYIVSFDGICNNESEVVFVTTDHFPTPIAEEVNAQSDFYYYDVPFSLPMDDIDQEEFLKVGKQVVKAFGIRKRFFHIEFFVLKKAKKGLGKKGDFIALECNMRAPGGDTPDLIDFGNSTSVFDVYADVITQDCNVEEDYPVKFYAFSVHRRNRFTYKHSEEEIFEKYHNNICQSGYYDPHVAVALGDRYFFGKFRTKEEGEEFQAFILEKAE